VDPSARPLTPADVKLVSNSQSKIICEMSYLRINAPSPAPAKVVASTNSSPNKDAVDSQYNVLDNRDRHITFPDDGNKLGKSSAGSNRVGGRNSSGGYVGGALSVKCIMQRVQLPTGVFSTQDIYGMDRNKTEDVEETEDTEGEGGVKPAVAAPTMTLDSDAVECVICLTDRRVIAVYPCRHMCLCAACAEVLPSQGNKCPICRRAAAMLLMIDPGGDDEEETKESVFSTGQVSI